MTTTETHFIVRRRTSHLSPMLRIVLGIVALVAIVVPVLIVTHAPRVVPHKHPPVVVAPKRVVPQTELPPVEPVEFQAVDPDDARTYNATIPFSTAPNPAARAFHIFGSEDSIARGIDCLAASVYYEAGDDAIGERAVAQVIINRTRHPAFPKSICGVVFQGYERSTGCQFTFSCDGAMLRYTPTAAAWGRARDIARAALTGTVFKQVGHATHYHTDWVVPYWSASLDKITEVHTHLFFRWAGWWGTPPAFDRAYTGLEPNIPLMARVSSAHKGDPNAPVTGPDGAGGLMAQAEALPASVVPAAVAGDDNVFLLMLPKGMTAETFAALAIRTCGERPYCKFMAWSDASKKPAKLPPTGDQAAAMSFSYLRDDKVGYAKALWNCDQYPRPAPVQCMRRVPNLPAAMPSPSPAPEATPTPVAGPTPLGGVRRRTDPVAAPPAAAKPNVTFTLPAPKATPTSRD
jgi:spore germination cell wall hydrolase CwlJ-like protein